MADDQELQVHQKREVDRTQESTTPTRAFMPSADIFETEDALTVVLEMPGVSKDNIDVSVRTIFSRSRAALTLANMRGCGRSMANTMWVPSDGASAFRAASIKAKSMRRCATA